MASRRALCTSLLLCGIVGLPAAALADPIEDFYTGKTMTVVIAFPAGGGYDIYTRLVSRHMMGQLPGKPTAVPKNMPGGGSRAGAGYVYNVAPRDGTVLATVSQSLPLEQSLEPDSKFDIAQFIWIGNPIVDNNTTVAWHATGVRTIDDVKKTELVVGSTGADASSQYPKVMNAILGTKFKIVSGYPGTNEMNLAMERGEIGGRGSSSWASWKATKPDWLRERKLALLVQIGLQKARDLQDIPLLMDLATNEDDRAVLRLLSAPIPIGRSIFTTPQVPPDRVTALRTAFGKTMTDSAFRDEARKANLTIIPLFGEELQKVIADIAVTPATQAKRLAEILK